MNFKKLIESKEYDFLRTNPHLGNNVCLLGMGGSHAYGTNVETSDVDIRGIAVETKRDILSNNLFEQVVDNPTDTTIYSLRKIINLLSGCNPNTIEMLGLKEDHYLYLNDIGKIILENKDLFLSKNAYKTFSGYASAQLRRLDNKSNRVLSQGEQEQHIFRTTMNILDNIKNRYQDFPGEMSFDILPSNKEDKDKEITISINVKDYPLRDLQGIIGDMHEIVREYDKNSKRNKRAVEHNKLGKHQMHLVRLYMMCIDILKNKEIITYREKEHDLLMDIRNGLYLDSNGQPTEHFFDLVKKYESEVDEAYRTSLLPNKPDMKKIDDLMVNIYEEFVF